MKSFSLVAILALATSAIASPIAEANAEAAAVEKRADEYFTFWTEVGFKGTKQTIKNPFNLNCYKLADPFYKTISSAGPSGSLVCTLWANSDCTGDHVTLRNPGSSDLRTVNFNDRAVAYQCQY